MKKDRDAAHRAPDAGRVPTRVAEMRVSLNPLPPLPQGASPSALKDHAAQLVSLRPDTMGTIFLAPGEYKGSVDHADIVARNRSEAIRELRHEMKSNQYHIGTERVAQAQAAAVKAAEQAGHPKEVIQALKDLVAEGAQQAQAQIQAQIDELDGRVRSRLAYVMGLGGKATDTEIERQIQDLYAGLPTTQEGLEAREREGLHAAAKFFEEHPDHIGVDHFVKGLGLEPGASKAEIAKAIDQADVSESARQSSLDDARRMEHMNELIGDYRAINPHAVR